VVLTIIGMEMNSIQVIITKCLVIGSTTTAQTLLIGWVDLPKVNSKQGPITAFGSAGLSAVKYTFTDHFHKNTAGKEITTETKYIPGYQIKGGLSYLVMPDLGVFGNAGYVSKAPIFDEVIDDSDGKKADDTTK